MLNPTLCRQRLALAVTTTGNSLRLLVPFEADHTHVRAHHGSSRRPSPREGLEVLARASSVRVGRGPRSPKTGTFVHLLTQGRELLSDLALAGLVMLT